MIDSNIDDEATPRQKRMNHARGFNTYRNFNSAARINELRKRYISATRPADVQKIWEGLIHEAKGGDRWAIEFVWRQLFGDPVALDYVAKLEEIQRLMNGEKPELTEFTVDAEEPGRDRWANDEPEMPNGE